MFFQKKHHTPLSTLPERFDTIIGQSTRVNGDMSSVGSMRVDGNVVGSVQVMEKDADVALVIGAGAHIEGDVSAYRVVIAGTVLGNVSATNQVEIYSTAFIRGNVQYASIAIEHGAQVQGTLIQSDEPMSKTGSAVAKLIAHLESDAQDAPPAQEKAGKSSKDPKDGKEPKKKEELLF